jgi:hypothetical protein
MRINWATFLHIVIAAGVGIVVLYVQKRLGGPVGGIIPGVLGLFLGWLIAPALLYDIGRLRRWVLRWRTGTELQPK